MSRKLFVALTLVPLLGGCSALLDRAMDAAADKAGSMIGDRVGTMIGNQAVVSMNQLAPQMVQPYAMGVFAMVYYTGGYAWMNGKGFQPGEYTQWQGSEMEMGDWFEKAFLKREANKQEWWRVRVRQNRDGKQEEAIFEALFSAPDAAGTQRVLRMRAKLPGQAKGSEVPITEENRDGWVLRPTSRLTAESLKGATVGTESVKVAAGTFSTKHVRFTSVRGQLDAWLSDKVPGGVVKYGYSATDDDGKHEDLGTLQLVGMGKNAKPMLQ